MSGGWVIWHVWPSLSQSLHRGTRSGVSRVDAGVAESPRIVFLIPEADPPHTHPSSSGDRTRLGGVTAESCFFLRRREQGRSRRGGHKRQKEVTSAEAFLRASFCLTHTHTVSDICSFDSPRPECVSVTQLCVDFGPNTMKVRQQLLPSCEC